jgi:hypothetical protein
MLAAPAGVPLHVFVVWEPVLASDFAPPTTTVLGLIRDPRAEQYWDPDLKLSRDFIRTALSDPRRYNITEEVGPGAIIWDTVALFPPGAAWGKDVPVPVYYGHPVIGSVSGLSVAIEKLRQVRPAGSP